ncbi:3'-5' exonuclease [Paracoccus jeotgali]|uniref:DNA-directed DNA polymerase n=1 Tax=Paracoccus jeotgali TaxID=2065379 RepID=A0A2K9ME01_9RHOB|nr:exonuclease domain-containing protein [Paracoccus jeotgali]AUM73878.1 3'-5' exonuclease [Paracoccus jeotgali]
MRSWPLRLRVFLIFVGLTGGILAAIGAALWVLHDRLMGAEAPTEAVVTEAVVTDALALAGLIAGMATLGLCAMVWYLFDINMARPIETLAGGLLTGAPPDEDEGRYLADLAPAARAAAQARIAAQQELQAAVASHAEGMTHEKSMLENILSDIGAGAILTDSDGRVMFYNAAASQLLPGLGLDRPVSRFLRGDSLAAAQARIRAGAGASDISVTGTEGQRLTGRIRPLSEEFGGTILILRPARRELVPPRLAIQALRSHSAALTALLDQLSDPVAPRMIAALRAAGAGLKQAMRDLDAGLDPGAPRQRRVAAEELARGLNLPLGRVEPVTLAADGWQIGGLLVMLAQRLAGTGRSVTATITREQDGSPDEAMVTLVWQGAPLPMDMLDDWLKIAPDPDMPDLTGADILDAHATGMWSDADPDDAARARLVLPLRISAVARAARASVTYDFALSGHGAADLRPLSTLNCVVFDTETTGLSLSDRIVQIAGLRIAGGKLTGERFETLVNPGRAIPPSSTRIHGVTDEMVRDAPDMATALRQFHGFAEDAVLIAHNAPFDMGLLRAAEPESGLHFPNRVMDTVLLSAMIWGQGAVHSLDALCERLGIELPPDLRHTAMGDAAATAEAYLRMLPALKAKGITRFEDVLTQAQKYRRLLSDANLAAAHGN